jgi:MFS superfamily sulfate permease-like transporter
MLTKIFPFLSWLKGYNSGSFRADLLSGLTVALVLIPQSMASQLAVYQLRLYAAFLPPMIAALFGSSRQLATGPVAVVSLMTAASLAPLATAGSEGYIAYALLLSLTVGVFQFLLGAKLGLVVNSSTGGHPSMPAHRHLPARKNGVCVPRRSIRD